jgi:hypothetical protein
MTLRACYRVTHRLNATQSEFDFYLEHGLPPVLRGELKDSGADFVHERRLPLEEGRV